MVRFWCPFDPLRRDAVNDDAEQNHDAQYRHGGGQNCQAGSDVAIHGGSTEKEKTSMLSEMLAFHLIVGKRQFLKSFFPDETVALAPFEKEVSEMALATGVGRFAVPGAIALPLTCQP